MGDYQRIKQTKYKLPRAAYHTTLWKVRDYYRLKELAEDIIYAKPDQANGNSQTSDKVASAVIKREKFIADIKQIDKALSEIPHEYRQAVWNNIQFGQAYPLNADRTTYGRYKSKFIYVLAERFGLI